MKIFLLYHSSGLKGPINFLENYLLRENHEVFSLEHPLDSYEGKNSFFSKDQKIIFKQKRSGGGKNNLFIDLFISIATVNKYSYDIFIGGNNFDTLPAIILRKLFIKKIRKIIYFPADFSEKRYKSILMNSLYTIIERFVIRNSDLIISNTNRAEKKRLSLGLSKRKSIVIPNGVYLSSPEFISKVIQKDTFIYVGNVTQEHGIFDFVVTMNTVIKKLVIIGQGDQWRKLKKYCETQGIAHEFFHKKDHEATIAYLQQFNGFGLAPYTLDALWTWYSSPLKVNEYIACGLPVVISKVPEIASYIDKKKLGIVYDKLDPIEVSEEIKSFDTKSFNDKAKEFYETYSYNSLYKRLSL